MDARKKKLEKRIVSFLNKQIEAQVFPGASVSLVWNGGKESSTFFAGTLTYNSRERVTSSTLYDTASVTKSVITSTLTLLLIEQGIISLQDIVQSWSGTVNGLQPTKPLTIHHLLTHTVAFNIQLSQLKQATASEILDAVRLADMLSNPGETYAYVNATSLLLGLELERVTGKNLVELAQEYLFNPLGMQHSYLGQVLEEDTFKVAPSEVDPWRNGPVQGEVHDESSWVLLKGAPQYFSGAAGLFTTASDMAVFMQAYVQGKVIRKELMVKCATDQRLFFDSLQLQSPIGLGWELNQERWMGSQVSSRTIGKTGFTGCCIGMDLSAGFGVALLCNHIYPKRPVNREVINTVRKQLFDLVSELV